LWHQHSVIYELVGARSVGTYGATTSPELPQLAVTIRPNDDAVMVPLTEEVASSAVVNA
jgi:hypothetical protein